MEERCTRINRDSAVIAQVASIQIGDSTKRFVGDGGFDPPARIWRYMELWKFNDLIERGLFFARLPRFSDKFEGTSPAFLPRFIERQIRDQGGDVEAHLSDAERWHLAVTMRSLATCWNERDRESDLFWRNYAGGPTKAGIAIVSTQERLKRALPENVLVSRVWYLDFEAAQEYSANPRIRAIVKSVEFEDERECRGIIHDFPSDGDSYWNVPTDDGYHVATNLESLIWRVIISPYSPNIIDIVGETLSRAGLEITPEQSTLNRPRYY